MSGLAWPKCAPWDTASPAGSMSFLWRWGLGQVPAFLQRIDRRIVLVQGGAGL